MMICAPLWIKIRNIQTKSRLLNLAQMKHKLVLKTRLAGEILQKFVNYNIKVAIIGDFTTYTSKSLRDFMYESNKGKDIFFSPSVNDAIEILSRV